MESSERKKNQMYKQWRLSRYIKEDIEKIGGIEPLSWRELEKIDCLKM